MGAQKRDFQARLEPAQAGPAQPDLFIPPDDQRVPYTALSHPDQRETPHLPATWDLAYAQTVCAQLVGIVKSRPVDKKLVIRIGQSDHLKAEAWEFLGAQFGVFVRPDRPEEVAGGFSCHATAYLRGTVLSEGYALCTADEPGHAGMTKHALYAKCQTRAVARALRHCLSWVTVLAGYSATPAEEMGPR